MRASIKFVNHLVGCHVYASFGCPFRNRAGPGLFNRSATRLPVQFCCWPLLAGCTTDASVSLAVADPSDPDAPVRAVRYSPVLAGYSSQRPVAPMPWRERNERVTPKGEAQ